MESARNLITVGGMVGSRVKRLGKERKNWVSRREIHLARRKGGGEGQDMEKC